MSFAGHVFDMIARMKANARRKRRPFDREVEATGPAIRPEYPRRATEAELEVWRQRLAKERKTRNRRERTILLVVVLVLSALVMLFW